jgi:hypothetical protein
MIEIRDLLSRFSDIIASEEGKKETIRRAVSEIIKVEISSKDIKIQNNTIYLNIKPIYKNEVFLKQDKIFLKLEEAFGKKTPQNIR